MTHHLDRFDVTTPDGVSHPAAALACAERPWAGLCLFLYGGGGSRETLAESTPLWASWWASGRLPPLVVATVTVRPFGFYLDEPGHLEATLIGTCLPAAVAARYGLPADGRPAVFGISMGGHAALAAALGAPGRFGPVVALQPMVEPGWDPQDSPARCRSHYPPGIPAAYLGSDRTQAAWRTYHPAWIAQRNRDALGSLSGLYLEAAAEDRFHAQEGARFVHAVLDDLGAGHTWVLTEGADHLGDSLVPRLTAAATWLGEALRRMSDLSDS